MKNSIRMVLFFLAAGRAGFGAHAQGSKDTIKNVGNVVVLGDYVPTVSDAFKRDLRPVISDTSFSKLAVTYSLADPRAETSFTVEPIKAAKIGESTIPRLYRFLIKGGFGSYTTPYGEFFFNTLHSKSYSLGVRIKHLSSSGKMKTYAYPGFSDNEAEVYGRKFYKKHTLYGRIGYERNVVHYYGYKPADFPSVDLSKNDIKQRFSFLTAEAKLNSNANPDSLKLNHSVDISYYNLGDKYGTSENNILLDADINKELRLIKITKSQVIGLEAKVDYYFNKDSVVNSNSGVIALKPYLKTKFKAFAFNVGIDLSAEVAGTTKLHLYPIAEVQFNIVRDILILYGGINGKLKTNSFRSLTQENPFVSGIAPMKPTSESINLYGGIRSNISRELSAHAWASYASVKDLPMFVTDTNNELGNKYTVIYDNSNVLHVRGELGWQKDDKISLRVGGDFWNYDMKNELKAWQKPYFDVFANLHYSIASKIILTADLYVASDRWAKRYTSLSVVPEKVKAYVDGNLGVEYRYNKRLSAFLNIYNIAAQKYFRWYNCRAYGFSLFGGLTYSF